VARVWVGVGGVLVGALAVASVLHPRHLVLEITNLATGRPVLCAVMAEGEEFGISFIHSVNKRPVHDTLRAARDSLVIVRSRFDAFGAGMPETTTAQGVLRVAPDGWLEWTVHRPVPEVTVRVGRVADHTLHLKGREIHLADWAEPGTALTMRIRKARMLDLMKGRCMP